LGNIDILKVKSMKNLRIDEREPKKSFLEEVREMALNTIIDKNASNIENTSILQEKSSNQENDLEDTTISPTDGENQTSIEEIGTFTYRPSKSCKKFIIKSSILSEESSTKSFTKPTIFYPSSAAHIPIKLNNKKKCYKLKDTTGEEIFFDSIKNKEELYNEIMEEG